MNIFKWFFALCRQRAEQASVKQRNCGYDYAWNQMELSKPEDLEKTIVRLEDESLDAFHRTEFDDGILLAIKDYLKMLRRT